MEENNGTYHWSGNTPQPEKKKKVPDFKRAGRTIFVVLLAAILLLGAGTCFFTVDDKQQAVVTTFGKVTDICDAGVHFRLPFGIQCASP